MEPSVREWDFDPKEIMASPRKVQGIFHQPVVDKDGELIKPEGMRNAIPDFMHFPVLHDFHKERPVGLATKIKELPGGRFFFEGVIKATSDCDDVWTKVQTGNYDQVSIFGKRTKYNNQCSLPQNMRSGPCITDGVRLDSISVCDENARNPQTSLEVKKAKVVYDAEFEKGQGFVERRHRSDGLVTNIRTSTVYRRNDYMNGDTKSHKRSGISTDYTVDPPVSVRGPGTKFEKVMEEKKAETTDSNLQHSSTDYAGGKVRIVEKGRSDRIPSKHVGLSVHESNKLLTAQYGEEMRDAPHTHMVRGMRDADRRHERSSGADERASAMEGLNHMTKKCGCPRQEANTISKVEKADGDEYKEDKQPPEHRVKPKESETVGHKNAHEKTPIKEMRANPIHPKAQRRGPHEASTARSPLSRSIAQTVHAEEKYKGDGKPVGHIDDDVGQRRRTANRVAAAEAHTQKWIEAGAKKMIRRDFVQDKAGSGKFTKDNAGRPIKRETVAHVPKRGEEHITAPYNKTPRGTALASEEAVSASVMHERAKSPKEKRGESTEGQSWQEYRESKVKKGDDMEKARPTVTEEPIPEGKKVPPTQRTRSDVRQRGEIRAENISINKADEEVEKGAAEEAQEDMYEDDDYDHCKPSDKEGRWSKDKDPNGTVKMSKAETDDGPEDESEGDEPEDEDEPEGDEPEDEDEPEGDEPEDEDVDGVEKAVGYAPNVKPLTRETKPTISHLKDRPRTKSIGPESHKEGRQTTTTRVRERLNEASGKNSYRLSQNPHPDREASLDRIAIRAESFKKDDDGEVEKGVRADRPDFKSDSHLRHKVTHSHMHDAGTTGGRAKLRHRTEKETDGKYTHRDQYGPQLAVKKAKGDEDASSELFDPDTVTKGEPMVYEQDSNDVEYVSKAIVPIEEVDTIVKARTEEISKAYLGKIEEITKAYDARLADMQSKIDKMEQETIRKGGSVIVIPELLEKTGVMSNADAVARLKAGQ